MFYPWLKEKQRREGLEKRALMAWRKVMRRELHRRTVLRLRRAGWTDHDLDALGVPHDGV